MFEASGVEYSRSSEHSGNGKYLIHILFQDLFNSCVYYYKVTKLNKWENSISLYASKHVWNNLKYVTEFLKSQQILFKVV